VNRKKTFFILLVLVLLLISGKLRADDCKTFKCLKGYDETKDSLIILIDPGHCSENLRPGAKNNNFRYASIFGLKNPIYEYYFNHKLGEAIKKELINNYGLKNVYISYEKKPEILTVKKLKYEMRERKKAIKKTFEELKGLEEDLCVLKPEGIFLSLHLNSVVNKQAHGSEEEYYYLGFDEKYYTKFNTFPFKLLDELTKKMIFSVHGAGVIERRDLAVMKAVKEASDDNKKMIYHSLSETGFLSNDGDMFIYLFYEERIRDLYANAIMSYYVKKIDEYADECIKSFLIGADNPDDNHSYSIQKIKEEAIPYITTKAKIVMPVDYMDKNAIKLIYKIKEPLYFTYLHLNPRMAKTNPVLIIPSGKLMEHQNDLSLKETLRQYVSNGGTIVVFAQQYGKQVENIVPIPDGEKLKVYGWREDQSCYWGSVYGSIKHPVLSSMGNDRASAAVDGYIDKYPEDSVVLLRRTKNRKPALLYYKYGEGTVILTTLYTDWGYAHSQASSSELNIVRDLLTFARDTESEIPMYNITETANPKIKLNLKLRNDTEYDAVKAKIRVLTPSRDIFKASRPNSRAAEQPNSFFKAEQQSSRAAEQLKSPSILCF